MTALWNELLQAAILGTERRPPVLPAADTGAVGSLAARFADAAPERRLQSLIILASLARRAATQGEQPAPLPDPCPEESLAAAPAAGASLLRRLLDTLPALVPEYCEVSQAAGRRLPEWLLPEMLEFARTNTGARAAVDPVLGNRGRWLARQNPEWAFAVPVSVSAAPPAGGGEPGADDIWQTGTREQRLRHFCELRSRTPEAARRLAERSWGEEDAETRAAVVQALAAGLSPQDEPFLETCLDDRRKEVRSAAQTLLVRLPQSAFAGRMRSRALGCFSFTAKKAGLLGRLTGSTGSLTLEVALPAACDKAMERDGIAAKVPAGVKLGERNWWFQQILAATPPTDFFAAAGFPAEAVAAAAAASDFATEIAAAWREAAKRCRDADWAFRLYRQDPARGRDLLPVLRAEQREQLVLDGIARAEPKDIAAVFEQLLSFPGGLPPAVARAAAAFLRRTLAEPPADAAPWYLPWEEVAMRFPAGLADETLADWPAADALPEAWNKHAGKFADRLRWRHEIRLALALSSA